MNQEPQKHCSHERGAPEHGALHVSKFTACSRRRLPAEHVPGGLAMSAPTREAWHAALEAAADVEGQTAKTPLKAYENIEVPGVTERQTLYEWTS